MCSKNDLSELILASEIAPCENILEASMSEQRLIRVLKVSELNTMSEIRARLIPRIRVWLISEFKSISALSDFDT